MSLNATSKARRSIVVTGGAGFVGSRLVPMLLQAADPENPAAVTVVDDLSAGLPMPTETAGLACSRLDIRDRAGLLNLFDRCRPDLVIHLAALHHIPSCERDPQRALDINVMGFQVVLDACRQSGCQRVLLASSGAVYAWRDGALPEDTPLAPQDVYAASKAANEHQLSAWAAASGGCGLVARMFNVIGPGDPNGHLIPDVLRRLQAASSDGLTLRLGNLDSRRDFVDVGDMAAGLAALAWHGWQHKAGVVTQNLCSGRDYSVVDIAERLAHHMGVRVSITSDPTLRRANDRPSQLGDPSKTFAAVGWRAERTLDQTIKDIVSAWQAAPSCV